MPLADDQRRSAPAIAFNGSIVSLREIDPAVHAENPLVGDFRLAEQPGR
jgi:hypothetical protein